MTNYIIRFDDLSQYSDLRKWEAVLSQCEFYGVKPLVGVIPAVKDKRLFNGVSNSKGRFWEFIKNNRYRMIIAIHGLHHENLSLHDYSGQFKILANSMKEFMKRNIVPDTLIPPNHMFNDDTVDVMKALGIGHLSDGVGLFPWKHIDSNVIQVPQIFWNVRTMPFGVYTFCFHPETMKSDDISRVGDFLRDNSESFISIYDADLTPLEVLNVPFRLVYKFLFKRKFGKTIPF